MNPALGPGLPFDVPGPPYHGSATKVFQNVRLNGVWKIEKMGPSILTKLEISKVHIS